MTKNECRDVEIWSYLHNEVAFSFSGSKSDEATSVRVFFFSFPDDVEDVLLFGCRISFIIYLKRSVR